MGPKRSAASNDGVKSADRVMAIMEFFRERRRPAAAREISDTLGIPRSSANVLLRSQINAGYLGYDEEALTYLPTLKLFQLGSWLIEGFLTDPIIDSVMRQLVEETQETVCMWVVLGETVRVLKVLQSPQAISLSIREGDSAPLLQSIVGRTFMAAMQDDEIARRLERHNKAEDGGAKLDLQEVLADIRAIRRRGVGAGYGRWIPDAGAVVAILDSTMFREPLALAVGGPMFRVRRNESDIEMRLKKAMQAFKKRKSNTYV
jgi:IclR family transcriptional regulator, KDG regulon repressor